MSVVRQWFEFVMSGDSRAHPDFLPVSILPCHSRTGGKTCLRTRRSGASGSCDSRGAGKPALEAGGRRGY